MLEIKLLCCPVSICAGRLQLPLLQWHLSGVLEIKLLCCPQGPACAGNPLVQYVVLRRDLWADLDWPLGSVVAQACHAATAALWLSREEPATSSYCAADNIDHMHKVAHSFSSALQ